MIVFVPKEECFWKLDRVRIPQVQTTVIYYKALAMIKWLTEILIQWPIIAGLDDFAAGLKASSS